MRYWHAWGRSGSTNAAKIECAHRRACKLLTDYNQKILTFHSIYDYFALLKDFNINILKFITISKINYLLSNHLICTTPDTEQIAILILHSSFKNSKMLFVPSNSHLERPTKFDSKLYFQVYSQKTN